ncbi:hypothetical protein JTE90_027029 [Oedothorax gibbosus]|uniref:SEC14-like protein 2 n=1 Tax=Oedothorax gibbosus TaxID=931172 RepID=A0AAV6UTT8_9ARAC|nr:hypothetical protein JTE90_027029 [Oedothorax gibbosus]
MTKVDIIDIEKSNIDELRSRLKGEMTPELFKDDNLFERFLRARGQNVDAAELMLRNHLKWRQANTIETIQTDYTPTEVLTKYSSLELLGFDKEGSPVIYCSFGNMDTRGIYKSGTRYDFLRYFVQLLEGHLEALKQHNLKTGKSQHQWVFIFDYDNFQLANATHKPTIDIVISFINMYDANYPERLKSAYLINGSLIFQMCWNLIRHFLSGPTFQKVTIFGRDGYGEVLRKSIDADILPKFLGGNKTDPDGNPRCVQSIRFGGQVAESYYIQHRRLSVLPDSMHLVVGRLSKEEVQLQVIRPGTNIEWEFVLKSKDVDYYVVHRAHSQAEPKEVVYKQRVEAGFCSETGVYMCEKAGIYSLVFDNSYSWIYSKHINYKFAIAES